MTRIQITLHIKNNMARYLNLVDLNNSVYSVDQDSNLSESIQVSI